MFKQWYNKFRALPAPLQLLLILLFWSIVMSVSRQIPNDVLHQIMDKLDSIVKATETTATQIAAALPVATPVATSAATAAATSEPTPTTGSSATSENRTPATTSNTTNHYFANADLSTYKGCLSFGDVKAGSMKGDRSFNGKMKTIEEPRKNGWWTWVLVIVLAAFASWCSSQGHTSP